MSIVVHWVKAAFGGPVVVLGLMLVVRVLAALGHRREDRRARGLRTLEGGAVSQRTPPLHRLSSSATQEIPALAPVAPALSPAGLPGGQVARQRHSAWNPLRRGLADKPHWRYQQAGLN